MVVVTIQNSAEWEREENIKAFEKEGYNLVRRFYDPQTSMYKAEMEIAGEVAPEVAEPSRLVEVRRIQQTERRNAAKMAALQKATIGKEPPYSPANRKAGTVTSYEGQLWRYSGQQWIPVGTAGRGIASVSPGIEEIPIQEVEPSGPVSYLEDKYSEPTYYTPKWIQPPSQELVKQYIPPGQGTVAATSPFFTFQERISRREAPVSYLTGETGTEITETYQQRRVGEPPFKETSYFSSMMRVIEPPSKPIQKVEEVPERFVTGFLAPFISIPGAAAQAGKYVVEKKKAGVEPLAIVSGLSYKAGETVVKGFTELPGLVAERPVYGAGVVTSMFLPGLKGKVSVGKPKVSILSKQFGKISQLKPGISNVKTTFTAIVGKKEFVGISSSFVKTIKGRSAALGGVILKQRRGRIMRTITRKEFGRPKRFLTGAEAVKIGRVNMVDVYAGVGRAISKGVRGIKKTDVGAFVKTKTGKGYSQALAGSRVLSKRGRILSALGKRYGRARYGVTATILKQASKDRPVTFFKGAGKAAGKRGKVEVAPTETLILQAVTQAVTPRYSPIRIKPIITEGIPPVSVIRKTFKSEVPLLEEQYMFSTGILQKQLQSPSYKTKMKVKSSLKSDLSFGMDVGLTSKLKIGNIIGQKRSSMIKQQQKQVTKQLTQPKLTTSITPKTIPTPTITTFFTPFPPLAETILSFSKKKRAKKKRKYIQPLAYRPSVAGILSGKTIRKAPKGLLSGAAIRYPVASIRKRR